MIKKLPLLLVSIFLFSVSAFSASKEWVSLSENSPVKSVPKYVSLPGDQSEVTFDLPGFVKEEKTTPRGQAFSISIPGGSKMLEAGMPDLPQLTFSLVIPGRAEMQAEVVRTDFRDYQISIAPSKGNLKRNIDRDNVPYVYSSAYSNNEFYPSAQVALRTPYILRDFRGQTIVVHPMQYNPVTQTLRVYYSITVRVSSAGNTSSNNVLDRSGAAKIDPAFASVYKRQFLNFTNTYTPMNEHGKMLVISDPSLMAAMQPFVEWKNKMGRATEMVDVSTIGTTSTEIKNYIETYYNTNSLTFVLLVGDGPQIPPYPSANGDSDPAYGYLLGSDSYAEVIVGRFSANNVNQVQTQVERTLNYEMYPDPTGDWYHRAVCIGSDQGPGDDNEMDFEHERNIRTDYLSYAYTTVDELFDGSQGNMDKPGDPNADDLNAALNSGRGAITYTGHGSSTSLGTTGYGISDVSALTNENELPFFWSVACVNGDFNSGTCLAEALMRSKSATGKPTGTIATFMSTINQSWDPPMDAQDEMVDILIESYPGNTPHTFGAISVSGCMHMNDEYGTAGDEMTDTWTTFGDPSLMVRTNTPSPLFVTHPQTIKTDENMFIITCTSNGAQVCLSKNAQIISTAWSLGGTCMLPVTGLNIGDTLDLVVTGYNAIPYLAKVIVTPPSTTDINSIGKETLTLYPNPSDGKLFFSLNTTVSDVSMHVINSIGQTEVVVPCYREGNNFEADLFSIAAGSYTVVIYDATGVCASGRVVIK